MFHDDFAGHADREYPDGWAIERHSALRHNHACVMNGAFAMMMPEGHMLNTGDSWRMFVSEGEAIEFPCLPCDEIHAVVKVDTPVVDYIKSVLKKGVAHHLVVVHGNVAEELKKTAELMRIECFMVAGS